MVLTVQSSGPASIPSGVILRGNRSLVRIAPGPMKTPSAIGDPVIDEGAVLDLAAVADVDAEIDVGILADDAVVADDGSSRTWTRFQMLVRWPMVASAETWLRMNLRRRVYRMPRDARLCRTAGRCGPGGRRWHAEWPPAGHLADTPRVELRGLVRCLAMAVPTRGFAVHRTRRVVAGPAGRAHRAVAIWALAVAVLVLGSCTGTPIAPSSLSRIASAGDVAASNAAPSASPTAPVTPSETPAPLVEAPTDGILETAAAAARPIVAVMIDDAPAACPAVRAGRGGHLRAGAAEGGIPRYMALYQTTPRRPSGRSGAAAATSSAGPRNGDPYTRTWAVRQTPSQRCNSWTGGSCGTPTSSRGQPTCRASRPGSRRTTSTRARRSSMPWRHASMFPPPQPLPGRSPIPPRRRSARLLDRW